MPETGPDWPYGNLILTPNANGVQIQFSPTAINAWLNGPGVREAARYLRFEIRTTNTRTGNALYTSPWLFTEVDVEPGANVFDVNGEGFSVTGAGLTPGNTYYLFAVGADTQ